MRSHWCTILEPSCSSADIRCCKLASLSCNLLLCSAGCDYNSVNQLNAKHLNPVLSRLVQTPYFRYFKVSLWCDCPFWPDDGMCALRDCSVCECPEDDEVAKLWRQQESGPSCQGQPSSACHHALAYMRYPWTCLLVAPRGIKHGVQLAEQCQCGLS